MITPRVSNIPAILGRLSALLMLLVVSACVSAPAPGAPPPSTASIKLKVPYLKFFSYAPYFIADAEGYFKEQGLDVELVPVSSMSQAIPALLEGQVDVLASTLSAAYFNAIGRGGRLIFVADKGYLEPKGCATGAIVARTGLGLGKTITPDKLRGLNAAVTAPSINGYLVDKYLASGGLSLDDVKAVNVPDELLSESLGKGTVDLAQATEPWLTRVLQDQTGTIVATTEQVISDATFSFIVYGPNLLDKNPEAGKRFMLAYLKAVRQYNQGKTDRNLEILSKATGLDRETLKKICWQPIREDGQIKMAAVLDFQSYLIKRKLVDNPVTDEKKLWDPAFINYATQTLKK